MATRYSEKMFSKYIKARMNREGYNQSELARRTGVPQERISRMVNDVSKKNLLDFVMLVEVLDTDLTKVILKKLEQTVSDSGLLCNLFIENPIAEIPSPAIQSIMAQNMLLHDLDEQTSCSHEFCPSLAFPKNFPKYVPIGSCIGPSDNSGLCFPVGDGLPFAFIINDKQNCNNFQLQC